MRWASKFSISTRLSRTSPASFAVFFFQAEDGIRDVAVTGVQTCALPILVHVLVDEALKGPFRTSVHILVQQLLVAHSVSAFHLTNCRWSRGTEKIFSYPVLSHCAWCEPCRGGGTGLVFRSTVAMTWHHSRISSGSRPTLMHHSR